MNNQLEKKSCPPDIPNQYKKMMDKNIFNLFDAGSKIFAIVSELGCDSFKSFNEKLEITIKKRGGF